MERLSFRSETDAAGFTILSNMVLLDRELTDGAKVTYLVLLHHARQAGKCFPGQERLSEERGVSGRSVRSHLRELVERGLITIERRGQGRSNLYWLEPLEAVYRKNSSTQDIDRKNSSGLERKNSSDPYIRCEEDAQKEMEPTLNVGQRSGYAHLERVVGLTGDARSLKRYAQLFDICLKHKVLPLWDQAERSLEKRLGTTEEPLKKPGAYFCAVLTSLLAEQGVYVPVGSKREREEIRTAIREGMGLPNP